MALCNYFLVSLRDYGIVVNSLNDSKFIGSMPALGTKIAGASLYAIAVSIGIPIAAIAQPLSPSLSEARPGGSLLDLFERESFGEERIPSSDSFRLSYRLATGDVVSIWVRHVLEGGASGESLRRERGFLVPADGFIHLPLIGSFQMQGLTLEEASNLLTQEYARYVKDPDVTLRLITARPLRIAVSGEVYRPGSYTMQVDKEEEPPPSVTHALKTAGGVTSLADLRGVQVLRQVQGQQETIPIDLWSLLKEGQLSQDILLRDGDAILVPTVQTIQPEEVRETAKASFSPDLIQVYVAGEVDTPGLLELSPNTTMNQALLASGGFLRSAKTKSVELIRQNPDGTTDGRTVRVDFSQGASEENNPVLRHGDAILVKRSSSLKLVNFFGGVLEALMGTARTFRDATVTILDLDD